MAVLANRLFLRLGFVLGASLIIACGDSESAPKKTTKAKKDTPTEKVEVTAKEDKIPATKLESKPEFADFDLSKAEGKETIRYFKSKEMDYDFFTASLDVDATSSQNTINVGGKVRMKKDSVFWMNSTYLGFEVMRLKLTKDSIFFLNKYQKTSLVAPIGQMQKAMGFNVSLVDMQNLFLGRMTLNGERSSYKKMDSAGVWLRQMSLDKIMKKLILDPQTQLTKLVDFEDTKTYRMLKVSYLSYHKVNGVEVPENLILNFNNQQKLKIEVSDSTFEKEELEFPFPKKLNGYRKL